MACRSHGDGQESYFTVCFAPGRIDLFAQSHTQDNDLQHTLIFISTGDFSAALFDIYFLSHAAAAFDKK